MIKIIEESVHSKYLNINFKNSRHNNTVFFKRLFLCSSLQMLFIKLVIRNEYTFGLQHKYEIF